MDDFEHWAKNLIENQNEFTKKLTRASEEVIRAHLPYEDNTEEELLNAYKATEEIDNPYNEKRFGTFKITIEDFKCRYKSVQAIMAEVSITNCEFNEFEDCFTYIGTSKLFARLTPANKIPNYIFEIQSEIDEKNKSLYYVVCKRV